ncbi:MAG TPA: hypothetical protein VEA78_10000, partial [Acidimicrobiales bacterium]|nr:hypothetical protein [Acidimicrobiales bacterium]
MEPQRAPRSLPLVPLLVGLVVAAALVAGALVLLRGDGDDDDSGGDDTAAPRTTPTADGEPPGEDDIDAVVAELSEFVADVRQL